MQVSVEISDDLLKRLVGAAHSNNVTLQQLVTSILESSASIPTVINKHVREEDLPEVEFY